MPVEVTVGPPVLTINQGTAFMVTDLRGEIDPASEQGVFAGDTRLLSHYRLYVNGLPWDLLTSATPHYYAARVELANPAVTTDIGDLDAHQVGLTLRRRIAGGIHEDLDLANYAQHRVHFQLEIALRSDFADLFEVRAHRFVRRGNTSSVWHAAQSELSATYLNADFERRCVFRLLNADSRPGFANGRVIFDVDLQPGAAWHTCACYTLVTGHRRLHAPHSCEPIDEADLELGQRQAEWVSLATQLTSSNEVVYRVFTQSVTDLGALRMHEQDLAHDRWVPAAGVPWYVALFGRDSLIASLQSMVVSAPLALGTLERLAQQQAREVDDWRDAEPGKIPHELRVGELAHLHTIPHTPYYGTADATILYLIALHETWCWLGDDDLLRDHLDTARGCLAWIDRYGDLDGDGFQEYRTRSPRGYENMGWKDSGDAVVYPDGSQVAQPKALVELQGYVYDAKMRMAEVFDRLGDAAAATRLRDEAAELRQRFEDAFWCEDLDCYAFGLDPAKRPIRGVTSNAGHVLWSGLASPERAARMVRRFMQADMLSGWGLRTLSAEHPAYNPYSYHRGSVWPHDNGLVVLGMKRYGHAGEAARVAREVFEAASHFASYRLPELYAGLPRRPGTFPVQYLGANTPQAWAAGSVFHLVQAVLGLRADAARRRLYVDPTLPTWLSEVRLRGMQVGRTRLTLRFWREGERSRFAVEGQAGGPEVEVTREAWRPWAAQQASLMASD